MLKPRRGEPVNEIEIALLLGVRRGIVVLFRRAEIGERREIEGVDSFRLTAR